MTFVQQMRKTSLGRPRVVKEWNLAKKGQNVHKRSQKTTKPVEKL